MVDVVRHILCLTTSTDYMSNNLPRMKNQRLPVQCWIFLHELYYDAPIHEHQVVYINICYPFTHSIATYYSLLLTSGHWVCSILRTHTLYVSLLTALCIAQTCCILTHSGWVPECTWAPADQRHEISVAGLMMCMYITFPYVNVWMCVVIF